MLLGESIRMAFGSLWGHKTRSLLTILGVVIGISSVLGVVTLGKSFEGSILGQFNDFDTRTVFVTLTANTTNQNGPPNPGQFSDAYSSRDVAELARLDGVEAVTPSGTLQTSALVFHGKQLPLRSVTATTPLHQNVRNLAKYAQGGPFHAGAREIVLGDDLAQNLNGTVPVTAGSVVELRFQGRPSVNVTVAGILAHTDSAFGGGNSGAYVPVDPFYQNAATSPVTGERVQLFSGLQVLARDGGKVDAVRDATKAYLDSPRSDAHGIIPKQVKLLIATQGDITASISAAFTQVTLFIGAIAVVSLVVGAIGIANIMLVSVTERTREIGVMKALGARNGEVLQLFLVEAVLIGLVGSAIGIGLGLGLGSLVVKGVFAAQKVAVVIPWTWVAISLVVGILVGVLAGFLPARRATKIQPIQALAYE
ncbi:MAG: putative transport system permease protein [Thermoplasmata archaeon]|jgi:putative ABC transport system permease protein|nr:putative transport system permease protein [Thermoplasmata archaeon]